MPVEIERKFLVKHIDRSLLSRGKLIIQGYLSFTPEVRVRISGEEAFLTIKGEGGLSRAEFEYPIPQKDAEELMKLCADQIHKTRHALGPWEIDVYHRGLEGLITAEIPLATVGDDVPLPAGITGVDVTADPRFKNKNLARLKSLSNLPFPP